MDAGVSALRALEGEQMLGLEVNDGVLIILIGTAMLAVRPHREYEAWEVSTTDGTRLVCRPGGEVAWWPSISTTTT